MTIEKRKKNDASTQVPYTAVQIPMIETVSADYLAQWYLWQINSESSRTLVNVLAFPASYNPCPPFIHFDIFSISVPRCTFNRTPKVENWSKESCEVKPHTQRLQRTG